MSPKKRDMPKWKVVFQALFSEEYISVDSDCKFQFHYRPLKSLYLCGGNRDIYNDTSINYPYSIPRFFNPSGSPPLPGTRNLRKLETMDSDCNVTAIRERLFNSTKPAAKRMKIKTSEQKIQEIQGNSPTTVLHSHLKIAQTTQKETIHYSNHLFSGANC